MTVKGYVDRIEVVAKGQVVARHERCYDQGKQILDPRHYLATLSRKPACLDHAPVFRDWKLPAVFDQLRRLLEQRHGELGGSRQFTRVLELLASDPAERLAEAIERTLAHDGPQIDLIYRVSRSCATVRRAMPLPAPQMLAPALPQFTFPGPT